ncbi:unnamed protein product [Hyaloperonospora brassicae]|uniref:Uncharacterized protein n=1 Tax=Hyaloperonospora brassicae TaxID=162125 RepID=A0AAV0SUA4_HYABA|nr:unnamed protein product [Hyaloperonospora brassicae]
MGKEELLTALADFHVDRGTTTEVDVRTQCAVLHDALRDIRRNRWRLLEDACSVVLRRVFELVASGPQETDQRLQCRAQPLSTVEGITLCLCFLEPLIPPSTASMDQVWARDNNNNDDKDDRDDQEEGWKQRAVLVAALLHLLAAVASTARASEVTARVVANILQCGIDVYVLFATLRFREELAACCRAVLPSSLESSDTESEGGFINEDEATTNAFALEDARWISEQVARTWGLTKFRYFLQPSGQAHAFAAWSRHGISNFVYALLVDDQRRENALSVIVSPLSWLFHVAAYAQDMMQSETHQDRSRGLELLRVAGKLSRREKLSVMVENGGESARGTAQSFRDQAASFFNRDWMSPLIQVTINAMVSFLEAKDRSAALMVVKELINKLAVNDRFWLLRGLLLTCPYGNASAALLDIVRENAVETWSSTRASPSSPFKTAAIYLLLCDVLRQAAERDLVFQADLLASSMSLVRFLYIRDKDNETGIRSEACEDGIQEVLLRIGRRLQVKMDEAMPCHVVGAESYSAENVPHLMIVEAALCSTLELLN